MQIHKINHTTSFGVVPPIPPVQITTPPPAIINECAGWLAQGKNALNYIQQAGITLEKGKRFIDIYSHQGDLIGHIKRPARPKSLESFVEFIEELRQEFAEYTDSKIRVVGQKGKKSAGKIVTNNLKGPGRLNVDKTRVRI